MRDKMRYTQAPDMREWIIPAPKKNQTSVKCIKYNPKNIEHVNAKLNFLQEQKLGRFEQHGHGWLLFISLLNIVLSVLLHYK